MLKRCEICGNIFEAVNNTKTCSEKCKIELKVKTLKRNMERQSEKKRTGRPVGRPKKRGAYREQIYKIDTSDTLCWSCQNATGKGGKCSWSARLEPVEGWKAKEVVMKHNQKGEATLDEGYKVKKCPQYIQDEPR